MRPIRYCYASRELAIRAAEPTISKSGQLRDERQLDEKGRLTAIAMGEAVRELGIPVGEVYTSPTYRALETVGWRICQTRRLYAIWAMALKACKG